MIRCAFLLLSAAVACGGAGAQAPETRTAVRSVGTEVSFARPPFVPPGIVEELAPALGDSVADAERAVSVSLGAALADPRYAAAPAVRRPGEGCPFVSWEQSYEDGSVESFGYRYIGMAESGVHVLFTSSSGGGSGAFRDLLFVSVEFESGADPEPDEAGMAAADGRGIALRRRRVVTLGDRWDGELRIRGNELFIGPDEGWFAQPGATSPDPARAEPRTLSLDLALSAPLDFARHRGSCADRE